MKVRVVANKPESSDCSDISDLIGKTFEVVYWYDGLPYVIYDENKLEIGLFDGEYEIVE